MVGMKLITIYLAKGMLDELDELVRKGLFPSRAEAIRMAISKLLQEVRECQACVSSQFAFQRHGSTE